MEQVSAASIGYIVGHASRDKEVKELVDILRTIYSMAITLEPGWFIEEQWDEIDAAKQLLSKYSKP